MAEKEIYHLDLVIDVKGDEETKSKLSAMDKFIERTEKRAEILNKMNINPAARINDKISKPAEKINSTINKLNKSKVEVKARLIDRVSESASKITSKLSKIKNTVWSATITAKDKASGVINTIKGGIGKVINMATSLQGILLGVGGTWAGIVKPMNIAGDFEQTQIAFGTMLHSAQKANDFLLQAQNMANATPFEFPQLANASKQLLAFGWNVKDILPDLSTIGDTAAGLGLGADGIQRITLALGQMKAKGIVEGQEMLQLTEAGVPATKILQEQLGLTASQVAEIGKQGISSDKAIQALLKGMNQRFGGMMQDQSKTALGLISTLKDTFENKLLNQWGTGLWAGIKPGLSKVTDWLDKNDKKVTELGSLFRKAGENVSSFIGGGLEKAQERLSKLMDSSQWKNANLGEKIKLSWDKIVAEPFSSWWNGSGKKKINKVAEDIGTSIGSIAGGAIDTVLNAFTDSKGDKVENAGTTAGQSFLNAFLKAFDTNKIVNKLLQAFKDTNLDAIKNPNASSVTKAGILDYGLYAAGGGTLLKGGFKFGKWAFGKKEKSTANVAEKMSDVAENTTSKSSTDLKEAAKAFRNAANESKAAERLRKTNQDKLNKAIKDYNVLINKARDMGKNKKVPESLSEQINRAQTKVRNARERTKNFGKNANVKKEAYTSARSTFKEAREASTGVKEAENVNRATKFFRFAGKDIKGIPIVGGALTLASAGIDIATSSNKKKATMGAIGNITGGIAGAKAGAMAGGAIGSILPGAGTAVGAGIGGIVGGIAGSIGGEKLFDWIYKKTGPAMEYIKKGYAGAKKSVQNTWNGLGKWFNTNVSTPVGNGFNSAKKSIENKWSNTKSWFGTNVGTPLRNGAVSAVNITVGAFEIGKEKAQKAWAPYEKWINTNVSAPVKKHASDAGNWIAKKYGDAKKSASTSWDKFSNWWGTNVSTPVKSGASSAGKWIGDKYSEAKRDASNVWSNFSSWWGTNVSTPVENGATTAGAWISSKYNGAKKDTSSAWTGFSTWFGKNVWSPVESGATSAGKWIGDKLSDAESTAEGAWKGFSSWFDKNIGTPVLNFIKAAEKKGEKTTGLHKKANGGIVTGPEFTLIGEAGTEAVIPLSSARRERGLSLWQQAGRMLGVSMFADGGIVQNGSTSSNNNLAATANISTTIALGNDSSDDFKQYGKKINDSLGNGIDIEKRIPDESMNKVINSSKNILNTFSQTGHLYGVAIDNDIAEGINSAISNITNIVKTLTDKVINQFKEGFGIHSPSRVFYKLAQFIPQGFVNGLNSKDIGAFIKKWVGDIVSMAGGALGGNVSEWLSSALVITGTPITWLSGLSKLVSAESGGSPTEINAQAVGGEHATGLLQMLPSTFHEFMQKGLSNIFNPIDNAASAINYIKSRYGSVYNTPLFKGGPYMGYAAGTNYATSGIHPVAEQGFEIVTGKKFKLFNGGEKVYNHGESKNILKNLSPRYYTSQPQLAVSSGYGDINVGVNNNFNGDQNINEIVKKATIKFAKELKEALLNTKKK